MTKIDRMALGLYTKSDPIVCWTIVIALCIAHLWSLTAHLPVVYIRLGGIMPKSAGNSMRLSTAKDDGQPINNLPGVYPTENWVVYYWDVEPWGELQSRRAVIQLPRGYAAACPEVWIGASGCVHSVRRWGIQCYTRILQDIGFDPSAYLGRSSEQFSGSDGEIISILINATHFDLPAYFVIASEEHPLLLFDPQGILKGSYTRWYTYLGALAYMVSNGKVHGYFGRLHAEDKALYDEALHYLLHALRQRPDAEQK